MFKTKVALLLGALALFIVSGIATSTASATGPFWHVRGSKLRQGEVRQIKLQSKGTSVLTGSALGGLVKVVIECRNSVSEGATIENSNVNGQDKGRITFTQCVVARPAGCRIEEPIRTNQVKSYLAINPNSRQQKFVDVFVPQQGTVFVILKFGEAGCEGLRAAEVEGSVAAEIIPVEQEVQKEGLLNFPAVPIERVVYQQQEQTIRLKFAGEPAVFSGTYGARLEPDESWGVFGQ